jgi:hypothetical protein
LKFAPICHFRSPFWSAVARQGDRVSRRQI